ncbi:MAG TPA: VOC family protein [Pseudonocardiaceae bacterium]|jgi:catechol 2,3-dioxygenase-like lactoylglutathione lyase family enzyme
MTWAGSMMAFVGVSDLDHAERFYGATLGFDLDDQRPFALVATVGATTLRITAVEQVRAAPYTVLGWTVSDIDATVDLLTLRGVEFTRYEGMDQDARGIWTAPSGARIAWFLDPDGNNLSLTQFG